MAVTPDLGELLDLAKAIGLVRKDGSFNPDWFGSPGSYTGQMLRDQTQLTALLHGLDALLGESGDVFVDEAGRSWVPIVERGGVALHLVVESGGAGTDAGTILSVGARLRTTDPLSVTDLLVPLVRIPAGAVEAIPGTSKGRVHVRTDVVLDGAPAVAGEPALGGLAFEVDMATNGSSPTLSVVLRGLQLPGEQAPHDLRVDGTGSPAALSDQALKLVVGVVQRAVASAIGPLAEVLALIGLSTDPALPPLGVAGVFARGVAAWRDWLGQVLSSPTAVQAWLGHVAKLIGTGAAGGGTSVASAAPAVIPPGGPGQPYRIEWTAANSIKVAATVRLSTTAAAAAEVELGVSARAEASGTLPAGLELDAVLARITLGPAPALRALPRLGLLGRAGAAAGGAPLVDTTTPLVGSTPGHRVRAQCLRVGLALDAGRKPVFVLAAHDVLIAEHAYPVLDLTNTQTLADVGGTALEVIAGDLLRTLGPREVPVRVLLGLAAPPGGAWPVGLTSVTDFLANPVAAVAGYHDRVLRTNRAGYPRLLQPVAALLFAPTGGGGDGGGGGGDGGPVEMAIPAGAIARAGLAGDDGGAPVQGSEDTPWRLPLTEGVALSVWADTELHIGLAVDKAVSDLGGGCPTVALGITAELARLRLSPPGGQALNRITAGLRFGARGGAPLRIGDEESALVAASVGLSLRWIAGDALRASLEAPGLSADIGGERASIALPTVAPDGSFATPVPWRALELLSGELLRRTGIPWARRAAALLGWAPTGPHGPGTAARLPLEALASDPVRALRDWALATPVPRLAEWLALVLAGSAGPGLPAGITPGRGDPAAPFALPLTAAAADAARSARVLLFDRAGHALAPEHFRPGALLSWLSAAPGAVPRPTAAQLGAALVAAAEHGRTAAEALEGRVGIEAGFAQLQDRWTDSDGLVAAADAALPGATVHDIPDVAHMDLPSAVSLPALGVPAGPNVVFVTGALGPESWPGIFTNHVLDLRAPGLPPEAFDVTGVATTDGPWAVRLPARADAVPLTAEEALDVQAARLARVVDALAARAAGKAPVVIVAHGAAGHAAARVATMRPGVTHLVTVGLPQGATLLDLLDAASSGDALQLLASLLPTPDPERPEHPLIALGRSLLAPLRAAYGMFGAAIELAPPASPPTFPTTVAVHCVGGRLSADAVSKALTGLVVRGLQETYESDAAPVAGSPGIGLGVGVRNAPVATAPAVRVRSDVGLVLPGLAAASDTGPELRVRIDVERAGGWLVGGPDATRPPSAPRTPALRRATLALDVPFVLSDRVKPRVTVVLHDGEALGIRKRRWTIAADADPLVAEARILIAGMAGALGPLPASGPVRDLVDLLVALGVTEPGTSRVTGAPVSLSADGVQRLLVDSGALLAAAPPEALANALARLLGAPAPPKGSAALAIDVDGLRISGDLAARTVRVQPGTTGLRLAAGATVNGRLDVDRTGAISGSGTLALGGGLSLELGLAPARVTLAVADGGGGILPARVALYPTPDAAGLARFVAATAPAEVLWAGITFIRSLRQPGVDAVLEPLLRAVGLLRSDGTLIVPVVLLADPARWLARLGDAKTTVLAVAGAAVPDGYAAAFDALGALLGFQRPRVGAWLLPYGIELSVVKSGTRAALGLALPAPPAIVGLRLSGSASLLVGGGLAPVPQGSLTVTTPIGSGRLTLGVGATGATARLTVPSLGLNVSLLPPGAGLAGSAGAMALHALPDVLDAIANLQDPSPGRPVGQALKTLGDRLGLRPAGSFDANQIAQLAAAPGPQLAQRLSANLGPGLVALRDLLAPMLPSFLTLTATGTDLTLSRANQSSFTTSLSVPSAAGVRVAAALKGRQPVAGVTLDCDAVLDASGLSVARALFDTKPANALKLGPLTFAPRVSLAVGAGATGPAGSATSGPHLAVGQVLDGTTAVSGVLRLGATRSFAVEATGASLAEAVTRLSLPLAANLALSTAQLQKLLARPVLGTTVLKLLEGVIFKNGVFDPASLAPPETWRRLLKLGANVATRTPKLGIDPLDVRATTRSTTTDDYYGLSVTLPPGQRFDLTDGNVTVQAEVDPTWIRPAGLAQGISLELLRVPKDGSAAGAVAALALRGLGLRVGRRDKPLLDAFVIADSFAAHGLIEVGSSGVTGIGGQLELAGLRVPVGSAGGGDNKIAAGIMRDTASGTERLTAKFSPALAVERRDGVFRLELRAGQGQGPWFIPIQRGFGPVYVEQVGLRVSQPGGRVAQVGVVVDGRVTLLGLTVAVDDLGLTAQWPTVGSPTDIAAPGSWKIDLAGLAVSATTGGLQLSGGLRRTAVDKPDYTGMLSLRFGPYGLTVYGGYGIFKDAQGHDFTSLFLFGALNAPIGGPPAFFVTGIGAGVGINRLLKLPPSMKELPAFPFVKALNKNSTVAQDPIQALTELATRFPPQKGAFWFAAGVSFTSFALVDCVAVLGVAVADGLEVTLMGLARAALPTTETPLAQLELALLVRFSTREGVLWVQGELTDNSWLLSRDVRLTGGFAYVSWFKGDKNGEFVLTVGGYHPSFKREGYPVVPRVGFRWAVSKILVVKGETYFALTSEAIMAGARLEATLTAGPLWAYLRVGADGIIFFDPFHFEVSAFAELGAGITVDIDLGWFGHIRFTISFHLHADVLLAGPNFHGTATIDIGVTSVTVAFGDKTGPAPLPLAWPEFENKYLRPAGAQALTVVPGPGLVPPTTAGTKKPPAGTLNDPILFLPEFSLTITTTAAAAELSIGTAPKVKIAGTDPLAIGPMQLAAIASVLGVSVGQGSTEYAQTLVLTPLKGRVPKGIWGPQAGDKPLPKGETLSAGTGVMLTATAKMGGGVSPIEYHQVEIGPRKPNPLLTAVAVTFPSPSVGVATAAEDALATADRWMTTGPRGGPLTPTAAATFRRRRKAPPQLTPLTHGLGTPPPPHVQVTSTFRSEEVVAAAADGSAPPTVEAVLAFAPDPTARPRPRTTVGSGGDRLPRVTPLSLAAVRDRQDERLPLKLDVRPPARPAPGWAGPGNELRETNGLSAPAKERLRAATADVANGGVDVYAGEVVVLAVPGADRDDREVRPTLAVEGAPARIVAVDTVGHVVRDAGVRGGEEVALPERTARLALVGGGAPLDAAAGWTTASLLVQIGPRTLVGPGCTLESSALTTRRGGIEVSTAFVVAAGAVSGFSLVTTRLPADVRSLAIALETGEGEGESADDRTLELGIVGAGTRGEPRELRQAHRTVTVHELDVDEGAQEIAVTVISGDAVDLAGVLGSTLPAAALAQRLDDHRMDDLLGMLVPAPGARARVRWRAGHDADPTADELVRR